MTAARIAPLDEPRTSTDSTPRAILAALGIALALVAATRLPVARTEPLEFDEFGFIQTVRVERMPMHHTLFQASARVIGLAVGDPYRGFIVLDVFVSALALVAVWWWLRALVGPRTAAAGAITLGVAPVFWTYGAMAGNYTAIPLVGSILLGIAYRSWLDPRPWHPYVAAVALAFGAGYRQDVGTFWLPVFVVILWRHRWLAALQAGLLFVALNLLWFVPMLREAGGWTLWRQASSEFAYKAGYLNSYWNLGFIDAPLRYLLKGSMALIWTLGPALVFVPRGIWRLRRIEAGGRLAALLGLCVAPALASHLLVHFGVPGYAFHYVPALLALATLGIGPSREEVPDGDWDRSGAKRLAVVATFLAAVFLFYPTRYTPDARGDFDLAFARQTRLGLNTPLPARDPSLWRTVNSQRLPEGAPPASARRQSLGEILER